MKSTPEDRRAGRLAALQRYAEKKRLARVLVGGYVYPVSEKRCSRDVQAVLARHPFRIFVQAYAPSKTW